MLPSLPYLFFCDSAQFLWKRRPHRKPERGLHPHPFWSYFFCWESEGRKMDGCLETPKSGCLWGSFTFKDAHWKAEPWPQQAGRQMPGRHPTQWSDERKALLFYSSFQHEVPGDCISMSNLHGEQQGTEGVGGGAGLAESPHMLPNANVAGWLHLCQCRELQGALLGAVEILSSCCLLFYWDCIPCPRQCSVDSAASEHVVR